MLLLPEFAARYFACRAVSRFYREKVTRRAALLEAHAGGGTITEVLTEPRVNAFLASLTGSPYTIKSYRADILALWHGAADVDLVPYPVCRRIFRPALPALLIDCYSDDEARLILAAAERTGGRYRNGVLRREYWSAVIRLAWDSGLRRGDVWQFRRDHLRSDGVLRVVQRKTNQAVSVRLHGSTVAALDRIERDKPCEWPLDPSYFGRHFKRLVRMAGVNRGTFKFLRRSSGSYVELSRPGCGAKHLGHADGRVFSRYYDARLGGAALAMPPEL